MLRSFTTTFELSADGREVFGRMFPFAEVAHIREMADGELDEYDEEFLPGCTARMRQAAQQRGGHPTWIGFTLDHDRSFDSRLGYCVEMVEADGGVDGTFRLYDDPSRLDKVRSMLAESHNGLSIEFIDVAPPTITGNLRQRRQIHVSHVTATPVPVYESARILAMRSEDEGPLIVGTPNLDRVRAMLAEAAGV
jgi:hypothetical protein